MNRHSERMRRISHANRYARTMPKPGEARTEAAWTADFMVNREGVEAYKAALAMQCDVLKSQRAAVDGLRTRIVQILAFVGSTTGFLVGTALSDSRGPNGIARDVTFYKLAGTATGLSGLAIVFALLALASVRVFTVHRFLRRERWELDPPVRSMLQYLDSPPTPDGRNSPPAGVIWQDSSDAMRDAVDRMLRQADANFERLAKLQSTYMAFLILMFVQLFAWVTFLWVRG